MQTTRKALVLQGAVHMLERGRRCCTCTQVAFRCTLGRAGDGAGCCGALHPCMRVLEADSSDRDPIPLELALRLGSGFCSTASTCAPCLHSRSGRGSGFVLLQAVRAPSQRLHAANE